MFNNKDCCFEYRLIMVLCFHLLFLLVTSVVIIQNVQKTAERNKVNFGRLIDMHELVQIQLGSLRAKVSVGS